MTLTTRTPGFHDDRYISILLSCFGDGCIFTKIQSIKAEWAEPIAIWNENPKIRLGAVLVALWYVWSGIVPTETASITLTVLDVLVDGLSVVGFVSLFTGIIDQKDWSSGRETSFFHWIPQLQFETRVWKGNQQSEPYPKRPIGYQPAQEITGDGSTLRRYILAHVWVIPPLWVLWESGHLAISFWGAPSIGSPNLLFIVVSTIIIHESIHAIFSVAFGCGFSVGILPIGPYIRPHGELLTRNKRIIIGLAPTILISLGASVLIFHAAPWLSIFAFWTLLGNTIGASSDIHSVWKLLKEPSKRLYYQSPTRDRPSIIYDHFSQSQTNSESKLEKVERHVMRLTKKLKIKPV